VYGTTKPIANPMPIRTGQRANGQARVMNPRALLNQDKASVYPEISAKFSRLAQNPSANRCTDSATIVAAITTAATR
jgi:hypothetical protein